MKNICKQYLFMCNMCAFLQTSRGREMERRRTEREREIESDTRDRLKEKEELEIEHRENYIREIQSR